MNMQWQTIADAKAKGYVGAEWLRLTAARMGDQNEAQTNHDYAAHDAQSY
jgi:hypothetical protein